MHATIRFFLRLCWHALAACAVTAWGHDAFAAADADPVVRPAAAREAAQRETNRPAAAPRPDTNDMACHAPAFESEPLRDLLDKYAPSAIEWSLLPHIAESTRPYSPRRKAAHRAG